MINIVVVMGRNREIGMENSLLWRLKDDMRFFKDLTTGHPVIMGRKTFQSLGRPLPNSTNIVVSGSMSSQEDVVVLSSVAEALEQAALCPGGDEIYVIGGGEIYIQTLAQTEKLFITHVDAEFPLADTFFPEVDMSEWSKTDTQKFMANERNEYPFEICTYLRVKN